MLSPGRRRLSPLTLVAAFVLLFTSTASAASAVLGIDLGTEYIKAALVKPGIPLEIVLTKDSKRKEASALAFKPSGNTPPTLGSFPERLYGGDALALAARFPNDVYPNLKPLLGSLGSGDAAMQEYARRHPGLQIQAVEAVGTIMFKSSSFSAEEVPWSVEELLAMELKNIRGNAEALAGKGSKVTDAVITIPAFYTADERRAVERAAELAGLNVMGLISDGLAVGVDYAKSREFPLVTKGERPEYHMMFDMGAGSTTATILRFQGRSVKDVGRFNKTVQEVAVVGTGWDRTLGGDALNGVIVDHMVAEFVKKPGMKSSGLTAETVKGHGRTAAKLWKEAERVRQVLSANSDARSSFEGLYGDFDFSTKLSRTEFEDLAAPFAQRLEGPFTRALEAAKLSLSDLDSIILHGGVIRTPFVQKQLEKLAGGSAKLRSNVNADESAVFGAAFKGAGLSPSFRVKEIRDSDGASYAAGITYEVDGKERQQKLFMPSSQVGGPAKQVTFKHLDDFAFTLYQQVNAVDRLISKVQTDNLTASVASLVDKFGCSRDEILTKFSIRLDTVDGLPQVVTGSVSCETEATAKPGSFGDSVKGLFGLGSKKGEQVPLDGGDDAASELVEEEAASVSASSVAESSATPSSKKANDQTKEKPKKRLEVVNVGFTVTPLGLPQPAPEEMKRMKDRLLAFDRSDKSRLLREEALNVLEGYTYKVRDLITDAGFKDASTDAQRTEISSMLSTTSEWLYSEGANAATDVLKGKLSDLKALVDPVMKRKEEALKRPEKLRMLQDALDQTKSLIEVVSQQVEKAAGASSSLAAEEAARASASPERSTVSSDEFADLEEPDTSSSSASASTTKPPKPPTEFSPYTNEDLTLVSEAYESISAWLQSKTSEQDRLGPHEDPAVSTSEIEAKATELNKVMMDLLQKKMRTPPRSSSSSSKRAKPSSKKTAGKKSLKGTTGASSEPTESAAVEADDLSDAPQPSSIRVEEGDAATGEEEVLESVGKAKGGKGPHDEL
ncbi:lumenal Hsp70 protein [Elasticomyces elasticus]|nr:lumenal Hsp70 protein [Elasticomyces elasticus]